MDQVFQTCSENPTSLQLNISLENGEAVMQQIIGQIVLHPSSTQKSIKDITFIHEKFKSLLLTTPAPSLVFRYGLGGAAVTFLSLKCAQIDSEGKIMISHLWKCTSGFIQVDDSFTFEKPEELRFIEVNEGAPMNRRRISFLGSDKEELIFDSDSQSIMASFIHTPAGTSATDEDRACEAALSTDEREASLKQREQEMDNRERESAEQERILRERILVLADLQGSEKIIITHLEARLSDILRGFEQKLTSKTINYDIEYSEVMEAKLAGYDRALKTRHTDARALTDREKLVKRLDTQLQEQETLGRNRAQELDALDRSLSRRDELLNERENELAAFEKANIELREHLDADREILESRDAAMEQGVRDGSGRYDTYLYNFYPHSSYENEDEEEEQAEDSDDHYLF
ncbi:hypothetical protein BOTNAR_0084g00250 [Botryotinia narcissicola]|uniref:Uncharacterized protein n=1 Tax=Botryotinia narcissicola TaxID=278944 RepID=A0A4Z1J6Q9_9HELO|nr:hypothetical protein BOTNAR_0084g00250 [Botryotinia narcissicola]